ncbi:MAG: RHS repeat-associated core domain-containing protein, partial [Clostridia bacterium]|nr:RHS repeat-associated core domain-containing protein [Clostridia bacterium]
DVVALVDGTGTKVVEYTYDAWGKPTEKTGTMAGTLGTVQPFRYRGYVWDEETGLYYLRSRYYRPEWCRFVSADNAILNETACLEAFSYASNNPIMRQDHDGTKDYIFTSPGNFYIENNWGLLDFLHEDRFFIEYGGQRYKANSFETGSRMGDSEQWNRIDFAFKESKMKEIIREANQKSFSLTRVFQESLEGDLDFKLKLDINALYMIDGILYDRNEAGNYVWAYYLCCHGINGNMSGYLAQGGSIVGSRRFDEWWDQKARWAGVRQAYEDMGLSFIYVFTYDICGYPQP